MDKRTTALIWFFILLILLAIAGNYYRVIVLKDYDIVPLEENISETQNEESL